MNAINKKEFCFIPRRVYSNKAGIYWLDYTWLSFVYFGIGNRWFREPQRKPVIKANYHGIVSEIDCWQDKKTKQYFDTYMAFNNLEVRLSFLPDAKGFIAGRLKRCKNSRG